jgi:hypothetical protein
MTRPTYEQTAASFDLWQKCADPAGATTREEFDAMSTADRIDLLIQAFGPEPERALTVDELLDSTAVGGGFHDWATDGAVIRVTAEQLRPALEAAYDPTMPDWPVFVDLDA